MDKKICPKTYSGKHIWLNMDIPRTRDILETLDLGGIKINTRLKCEACGMIDDKYRTVILKKIFS